jgi:hypothetical protein
MQLDPKADCRPWPLAGYAPGNYTCKCIDCEERFSGDKRAIRCLECAAVVANQRLQAVQPVPVVTDEPEFQTAPDNGTVDEVLAYVLDCARRWEPKARIIGNARAGDIVRALTATASAEPVAIPDGWKLVPVKPTNEMVSAVRDIAGAQAAAYGLAAWDTMLKAAPVSGGDNAK